MVKKLFISQPMNGRTDEEIKEERYRITQEMVVRFPEDDISVIDSFFEGAPVQNNPLWFLGKSLECLSGADIAYFAPGWETARGCYVEHHCAIQYGIPTVITCNSDGKFEVIVS